MKSLKFWRRETETVTVPQKPVRSCLKCGYREVDMVFPQCRFKLYYDPGTDNLVYICPECRAKQTELPLDREKAPERKLEVA